MSRPLAMVLLAAAGACCVPIRANDAGGWDVSAGFAGTRRTGSWTPLVVSAPDPILQPGDPLHVWVEDPDGQWVRSPLGGLADSAAGRTLARFCVRFGTPSGRVLVAPPFRLGRLDTDDGEAPTPAGTIELRCPKSLPSTDRLLLVCGDLPAAAATARLLQRDRTAPVRVVTMAAEPSTNVTAGLPASARDFDAADAIIICGSQVAALAPDTLAAIDGWVHRGGRLVLAAGATAREIAAGPAAGWLPGRVTALVPLRRFATIEAYARSGGLDARTALTTVQVPSFAADEPLAGVVDVTMDESGGRPLVVRRSLGLGGVTWIGADLDADPFRGWPGLETLLVGLLEGRVRVAADTVAGPPNGGTDLAGQLRAALERFPGMAPVPFEVVAAIGLLYVASLYPLDWWLTSRGGRHGLAWITLPVLATAFTALAWATGDWWGRGLPPACRAAELIDIDAAGGLVRGTSWAALRSPQNARLDVDVSTAADVAAAPVDAALSWFADAGPGLGGVDAAVPHPALAAADYAYGSGLAELEAVPIAAGATRVFEAEWFAATPAPVVTSTLARTGEGTLQGAVRHHLPFPLDRCQLMHGGWVYDVGTLNPGQSFDTAGRGPRSLSNSVRRARARREREAADRWDPTSTDVERILEVAGFHAAAGGIGYTLMEAGRLQRLDLSRLLVADRAVLVGDAGPGHRATGWLVRPRHSAGTSWPVASVAGRYRLVIPVVPDAAEPAP